MHSPLDDYLRQIEERLQSLPPKARKSEMREMRAHLAYDILSRIESGQSEAAATRDALAQFGDADEVAEDLARTHSRIQALERRTFWRAVAWSLVATVVARLVNAVVTIASFSGTPTKTDYSMPVAVVITYIGCYLTLGARFPKVAVQAVGFLMLFSAVTSLPGLLTGYGLYVKLHMDVSPMLVGLAATWGCEFLKLLSAFVGCRFASWRTRKVAFR